MCGAAFRLALLSMFASFSVSFVVFPYCPLCNHDAELPRHHLRSRSFSSCKPSGIYQRPQNHITRKFNLINGVDRLSVVSLSPAALPQRIVVECWCSQCHNVDSIAQNRTFAHNDVTALQIYFSDQNICNASFLAIQAFLISDLISEIWTLHKLWSR